MENGINNAYGAGIVVQQVKLPPVTLEPRIGVPIWVPATSTSSPAPC